MHDHLIYWSYATPYWLIFTLYLYALYWKEEPEPYNAPDTHRINTTYFFKDFNSIVNDGESFRAIFLCFQQISDDTEMMAQ